MLERLLNDETEGDLSDVDALESEDSNKGDTETRGYLPEAVLSEVEYELNSFSEEKSSAASSEQALEDPVEDQEMHTILSGI